VDKDLRKAACQAVRYLYASLAAGLREAACQAVRYLYASLAAGRG
jgi:hypothetical protein